MDDYQVQDVVNGYLKDIRRRFHIMIREIDLTEEQSDKVEKYLGYCITASKDNLTLEDARNK